MRYAIITGGWSPEKEENVTGAQDVSETLSRNHQVQQFIFDNEFPKARNRDILAEIQKFDPDVAFLCTTEELPIQGTLQFLSIPYTGPSILPIALSLDKEKCKRLFAYHGIKVPRGKVLTRNQMNENISKKIVFPVVIKPNRSGSSCGVTLAEDNQGLLRSLEEALKFDSQALVEEFIEGREITVPMLDDFVMPPVEVVKERKRLYDYESKSNYKKFVRQIPAELEEGVQFQLGQIMLRLRQILHLENVVRADFIITSAGEPILLEINTLPYLGNSMMGVSARKIGWTYSELLERIAQSALQRYGQ